MMRKRTRSDQKNQMVSGSDSNQGQSESQRLKSHRNGSFFSIPSLFVGFNKKGSSENDPAQSPTTPLDLKLFPRFGNLLVGSPKTVHHMHYKKSWDSCKVGLSIVDSLEDRTDASGKVLHSTESKSILFKPGMRFGNPICPNNAPETREPNRDLRDHPVLPHRLPKIPPKGDELGVVFEVGDKRIEHEPSSPMSSRGATGGSGNRTKSFCGKTGVGNGTYRAIDPKARAFAYPPGSSGFPPNQTSERLGAGKDPILESEIELSEDYTCVITHGPNPKTTHFYGDRVLESLDKNDLKKGFRYKEQKGFATIPIVVTKPVYVFPSESFLTFCNSCDKGLQGEDIYMYRGEIAFCSEECRAKEILADEEIDEAAKAAKAIVSDKGFKEPSEEEEKKKKKCKKSNNNNNNNGVVFTVG